MNARNVHTVSILRSERVIYAGIVMCWSKNARAASHGALWGVRANQAKQGPLRKWRFLRVVLLTAIFQKSFKDVLGR